MREEHPTHLTPNIPPASRRPVLVRRRDRRGKMLTRQKPTRYPVAVAAAWITLVLITTVGLTLSFALTDWIKKENILVQAVCWAAAPFPVWGEDGEGVRGGSGGWRGPGGALFRRPVAAHAPRRHR